MSGRLSAIALATLRGRAYLPLMNARTRVSSSGDVAIPKDMRDRFAWTAGTPLELVETAEGLSLRPVRPAKCFARKSLADLRALLPAGPAQSTEVISRLSDDDLRRLIQ